MAPPVKVFCCYAREDQKMLIQLKKHLMPLQRQGQIMIWSDTNINAGAEWEKELHKHLESADIILLLVSPDFMASDYCYSTEMSKAIQRHNQGSACVIPVLLRSVLWQNAPFAKLQMVPTNAEPVTSWSDHDQAFRNIAERISQLIIGHSNQPNKSSPSPAFSSQPSLMRTRTSQIDISGEWLTDSYHLFLSQIGTKITGTGSHYSFVSGKTNSLTLTGSIDRTSIKIRLTWLKNKCYSELHLTFVFPGKMSGYQTLYYRGLFKGRGITSNLTLVRQD